MKYIWMLLLSMSTGILFGQSTKMATYEEVFNEFYTKNQQSSIMSTHITFEKKKDKWYVVTYDMMDYNKQDSVYLFYSNGKFQPLPPHSDNTTFETQDGKDYLPRITNNDIINYNLHQYFGYSGWYNDVIKDAMKFSYTTDSATYSLGRAYSTLGNALLSNQYGDAASINSFQLPFTNNCMTPGQIRKYDSVIQLAILNFKKTFKANPDYKTFVGPIQLKYANEFVSEFHQLLTYAADYAKDFRLPDNLYPDSVIRKYKQALNDCPKDAILLTVGDNDFYPCLYLQHHDGIRKDVYLINSNLLGLDRYILRYQSKQFDAKAIDFGKLDTSLYIREVNSYIINKPDGFEKTVSFSDLFNSLQERKTAGNIVATNILLNPSKARPGIEISLKDKTYILKNEWALYTIIAHLGERKLCCSLNEGNGLDNLNAHFKKHESIYILE